MKVLILTAIPFWHAGTGELIKELRKKDIQVEALDIFHGRKFDKHGRIVDLVKLPGILRRLYLKLFRQHFTNKHIPKDAIVDVHFVEPYYSKYLLDLPNKISCSLFGSDLYRTNAEQKNLQSKLFNRANSILLSENMAEEFEKHFPNLNEKFYFNQYGSNRISIIQNTNEEFKKNFDFPKNKKIVCCAYNAKKEQQHKRIIDSLTKESEALVDKIHLVFPLTYGNSKSYIDELKNYIDQTKFTYTFITNRLSDDEMVALWKSIDISINTQTSDALSSSIKEAMACRNILLVGEWLPYDIYTKMGIEFEKINFENMAHTLLKVLSNFEVFFDKTKNNKSIIYEFASWEYLIDKWVDMYKKLEVHG